MSNSNRRDFGDEFDPEDNSFSEVPMTNLQLPTSNFLPQTALRAGPLPSFNINGYQNPYNMQQRQLPGYIPQESIPYNHSFNQVGMNREYPPRQHGMEPSRFANIPVIRDQQGSNDAQEQAFLRQESYPNLLNYPTGPTVLQSLEGLDPRLSRVPTGEFNFDQAYDGSHGTKIDHQSKETGPKKSPGIDLIAHLPNLEPWKTVGRRAVIKTSAQAELVKNHRVQTELAQLAGKAERIWVPTTDALKLPYVEQVLGAILNFDNVRDKYKKTNSDELTPIYKRFAPDGDNRYFYSLDQLEVKAWKLVNESCIRQQGIRKIDLNLRTWENCVEFDSFDERIDAICRLLYSWKLSCSDLFNSHGVLRIVDAPAEEFTRKVTNAGNNEKKNNLIKKGGEMLAVDTTPQKQSPGKSTDSKEARYLAGQVEFDENDDSAEEEYQTPTGKRQKVKWSTPTPKRRLIRRSKKLPDPSSSSDRESTPPL